MASKNRQVILLINGVPYTFPAAYVTSESYSLSADIQLPTKKGEPPIITPGYRVLDISLTIPMDGWKNKLAYKTAREVIRATHFLFCQRDYEEDESLSSTGGNTGGNTGSGSTGGDTTKPKVEEKDPNDLTIPFTKLTVPWDIRISCAYFGVATNIACCILSSFDVNANPSSSTDETWKIRLTEFDINALKQGESKSDGKSKLVPAEIIGTPR